MQFLKNSETTAVCPAAVWRRPACQCGIFLLLGVLALPPARAVTLQQVEQAALQNDPVVAADLARSAALREAAVAEGQLPDPKLKLGLFNLPLDTFDIKQEPTTQLRFGINQAFPRGDTLQYRQRRIERQADVQQARAEDQKRKLLQAVREYFLDLYFQSRAGEIIQASRGFFVQLVEITQAQFASGRANQQDVLRAQLELSRLDDRATRIRNREEVDRSQLAKWIGDLAWQPVPAAFPSLPAVPAEARIEAAIERHPQILMTTHRIEASNQAVQIAREQYSPGWNVGLEYRKRFGENPNGTDRTDMMAAMLSFDLPLFTGQRQDKRLAASQQRAHAARLDRADRLRQLKARLKSEYANWRRLGERQALYRHKLLREAAANAEASLKAYQSGLTEFTTLMRARLTELEVRLADVRIRVERAKARTRLLYLNVEDEQ
jgi:outer membrane protein TolC